VKAISAVLSAVRRKGLRAVLSAMPRRALEAIDEYQVHRWYERAHARNHAFDRKFGVDTTPATRESLGWDSTVDGVTGFNAIYEEVFWPALKRIRIEHERFCFIDLGAGKGKSLLLASRYPFRRIIGVELSADLCQVAERNVLTYKSADQTSHAFEIICGDASEFELPEEPCLVFLFNPFRGAVMQKVVNNLIASSKRKPRPLWIVYVNPDCAAMFEAQPSVRPVWAGRRFRIWRVQAA
jgi:hypothetical protein